MLEIDLNKKRTLNFEVELSGIDYNQLNGAFRFSANNIEYGFPVEVKESSIIVDLPPLKNIIHNKIKEGEFLDAKLEMNGNGYYLSPWNGKLAIKNLVKMEVKITEDVKDRKKPNINIKREVKGPGNIKEEINLNIEERVMSKMKEMRAQVKESKNTKKDKNSKITLNNLTKEHIFKYIELNGSKNKKIQEIIYNRAKDAALPKTENKHVMKEVVKIFKKFK